MNCDKGIALFIKFKNSSFSSFTKVSGSAPSGRKIRLNCTPSFNSGRQLFIAFHAADLPATSPSKQKVILFVYLIIFLKWNFVNAVPKVATQFLIPELCNPITSVYPSTIKTLSS